MKTIGHKLIFAQTAALDLGFDQININTAFLNGDINIEVYIEQTDGLNDRSGRVYRLKKSLYGLIQSGIGR